MRMAYQIWYLWQTKKQIYIYKIATKRGEKEEKKREKRERKKGRKKEETFRSIGVLCRKIDFWEGVLDFWEWIFGWGVYLSEEGERLGIG